MNDEPRDSDMPMPSNDAPCPGDENEEEERRGEEDDDVWHAKTVVLIHASHDLLPLPSMGTAAFVACIEDLRRLTQARIDRPPRG